MSAFVVNGERYLNYRNAFSKSLGKGEYGGRAHVTIDAPAPPGNEVFMWHYRMDMSLHSRLIFPHR